MEKVEEFKSRKIGTPHYINENCWLAKTLNYSPVERCWYCELKFRHCPFFQYLIVSLILIFFSFTLLFFIEEEISKSAVVIIFALIVIYGYFFNKSTEKLIKANFQERKLRIELGEEKKSLEIKVAARTKELKELAVILDQRLKKEQKSFKKK